MHIATNRVQMLTSRRYDLTVRELIDLILSMTPDERGLLLEEARQIKTKLRATRRNCCVSVQLIYDGKVHSATVTNLSFTGAFVECFVPVMVGDSVSVMFKSSNGSEDIQLDARIVHATKMGIGIKYKTVRSAAARFLQKCLDDFKTR